MQIKIAARKVGHGGTGVRIAPRGTGTVYYLCTAGVNEVFDIDNIKRFTFVLSDERPDHGQAHAWESRALNMDGSWVEWFCTTIDAAVLPYTSLDEYLSRKFPAGKCWIWVEV